MLQETCETYLYTGCPKKNETGVLAYTSGHKESNYIWPIFCYENKYTYLHKTPKRVLKAQPLNILPIFTPEFKNKI